MEDSHLQSHESKQLNTQITETTKTHVHQSSFIRGS